ncbi:MAG: serine hydrolase [Planctomycetota bacterium]
MPPVARPHTLFSFLALASLAFAQSRSLPLDLDARVDAAMQAFEVPGLCVAIVRDGKIALAKGYGVRHLGSQTPVDAHTRFGIASNTKVFTALALGLLVEAGRLEWDAPVQRYLPAFQLADPYVSRELTVRDLLVHRSGLGLGAGDLLWWPGSTYDRKEIVRRLRHVPLATSFRSTYAYDNVLYLVAGELIEAVSGSTWERFVAERILAPVGMEHSSVRHSDAVPSNGTEANVSGTHAEVDGRVVAVPPMTSDNTNPAGGIMSCAEDMAKWLGVLLARGQLADGSRLFSAKTYRELTTLVTPIPIGDPDPLLGELRPNFNGYALGLAVRDYRGRKVLTHTGGLPGFVSRVLLVPEAGVGIAVLTNQESMRAIDAIVYQFVDHVLGADDRDWLALQQTADARARAKLAAVDEKARATRAAGGPPSLPLARYAGTFHDAWCGDLMIEATGDGLSIRFAHCPQLSGKLEPWQHDTFVARWHDRSLRADAFVTFALTPDANIDRVRMLPASPSVDFSFDYQHLDLRPSGKPVGK